MALYKTITAFRFMGISSVFHLVVIVQAGQLLVRVNGRENGANVGVNQVLLVAMTAHGWLVQQ